MGERCLSEFGDLPEPQDWPLHDRVLRLYDEGDADDVLDILELMFQVRDFLQVGQEVVKAVNDIFREEGVGYEFTPYHFTTYELEKHHYGGTTYRTETDFPEAIKKTNQQIHTEVIAPTMQLLSGPKWKVANQEMHDAHRAFREARYEDAIAACGRSFETVFKTIFTEKGIAFDADKDTLAKLVDIANSASLFAPFYAEIFKASGTIRNKLGGHGKGPKPKYDVDDPQVQHMIQQTSAHILLLAKLSGL